MTWLFGGLCVAFGIVFAILIALFTSKPDP